VNDNSAEKSRNTPRLCIGRYRLRFEAARPLVSSAYRGSAWRGVLGYALRHLTCVTREKECPACLLYHSCVYPYIFETPPPPGTAKMKLYRAAPHPFVLAPRGGPPGRRDEVLGLTLFGRGNRYLAYLVHALSSAGERGLKPEKVALKLVSVEQEETTGSGAWQRIDNGGKSLAALGGGPAMWPQAPEQVRLRFHTPLRLKQENDSVTPETFEFAGLFGNLLRRMSLLTFFHSETPLEADFAELMVRARNVRLISKDLRWRDWTRYSNRQKTAMKMGGLVGGVELDLAGWPELWPYLWLGQWTHAGKGTSMGLGCYEVVRPAEIQQACEAGESGPGHDKLVA
jgi:hypothetical protein